VNPGTLSTGLALLDRRLGGGLPAGSLVTLAAPPDSQSELLLYEMAAANRSRYLSTLRAAGEVQRAVGASVGRIDGSVERVDPESLLAAPRDALPEPGHDLVVVDTTDAAERRGGTAYRDLLEALKTWAVAAGGAVVLHCHTGEPVEPARKYTLARADVALELDVRVLSLAVETRLIVRKLRGGVPPDEPIKLRVRGRVAIDSSRDIA
jgi:KaiC/GvpD/RAD55 family RecA-like ATPase